MISKKIACITLDLENDWYFSEPGYDHLTFKYIDDYIRLIEDLNIPITFFVVGRTLERFPAVIEQLNQRLNCEFHLHSYQHDTSKSYDFRSEIRNGKNAFKSHFDYEPEGYRAPQGNIDPPEFKILEEEGFKFDSSIFPSYRPGVYNNVGSPTYPYQPSGTDRLVEIPISVTPKTRIPFSHSYLKLFGAPFMKYLEYSSLPPILVYNTHLQDLYRTDSHTQLSQPKRAIFNRNMSQSVSLFQDFIKYLQVDEYQFVTMNDLFNQVKTEGAVQ